jgi:hypothetical protein
MLEISKHHLRVVCSVLDGVDQVKDVVVSLALLANRDFELLKHVEDSFLDQVVVLLVRSKTVL